MDGDALPCFHPTVRRWFLDTFGEPSLPQREGWPAIADGRHTLIAAPTGSGKTLAAFLIALDRLLREVADGRQARTVLYVSPLKALSNDVQRNLLAPLAALRDLDPTLPELSVMVRTGDTPNKDRAAMRRRAPHVLVTTPESLHVLLASASGRDLLSRVGTVIVDEIHSLAANRRGTHLAIALELLATIAGEFQRIGLSATQRPLARVANFLVGEGRACHIVDGGHLRNLDLDIELPELPLGPVASEDQHQQSADRIAALIAEHRTTIVFANTRKTAERMARRLADRLGSDVVTSHHGSLSRERRLDAEERLKSGALRAIVATASLELGIDVGDVDLVVQLGANASIAQLLQRAGRAGHGAGRVPKGRLFPTTVDELATCVAVVRAIRTGRLDEVIVPTVQADILAQCVVLAVLARTWTVDELLARLRRAMPCRDLDREALDAVIALHLARGRFALLFHDTVDDTLRATKRAALIAVTSGGAIPDRAEYEVVADPEGIRIGAVDEDFAIESTIGDVFQLGNLAWRVTRVERGRLRVVDAHGAPPSMPFWFGEAPARSDELTLALEEVRDGGRDEAWLIAQCGANPPAAAQLAAFLRQGRDDLGAMPSRSKVVLERFFDDSGGTQLVMHAPFGSRINRAIGLALRKRFCRGFGFELQAAANEDSIVLSLGPMHAFPLEDVFDYLHPRSARDLLIQALLAAPMFQTRWRWNVARALIVPRASAGKRVPANLMRMRADDELAAAFPQVMACGENLPPGDLPVPMEHPLVRQTIEDCLTEAMDVDGFLAVVRGLRDGSIERVAVDRNQPSVFAHAILNARPYMFLDDAPLEERRTQAVSTRTRQERTNGELLGEPDPQVVEQVREDAWPRPNSADELLEALSWMGYLTRAEAVRDGIVGFVDELLSAGKVVTFGDRILAIQAPRDELALWRGRLEALGPIPIRGDEVELLALEAEGTAMRLRIGGVLHLCHRRLLARIRRESLERVRAKVAPVSLAEYWHFVAGWQHATAATRLDGTAGLAEVLTQLQGFPIAAERWESVLRRRLRRYRPDALDQLTLGGEFVWLRLFGSGNGTVRRTPIAIVPRGELARWLPLRDVDDPTREAALSGRAQDVLDRLRRNGASFVDDCRRAAGMLPSEFESCLAELVTRGLATVDSFGALRALVVPPSKRRADALGYGIGRVGPIAAATGDVDVEFVIDRLLARWGVVFQRILVHEGIGIRWRDLLQALRVRELAGTVHGGRFLAGVAGEQFAAPNALPLLRAARGQESEGVAAAAVGDGDPLHVDLGAMFAARAPLAPTVRVDSPSTILAGR
jgi:ATP-dependent Lhr-like helicase